MFTKYRLHAGRERAEKCRFLPLVTLTFDLQARPNEGRHQKQNLPQLTVCGRNNPNANKLSLV